MDVEKTMQFILEQNAQNTVKIDKLSEQISDLRAVALSHERDLSGHENDLQAHTEWMTGMSRLMQDLASQMKDGFNRMTDKHAELAEKQAELAEAQKTTEGNLNILIRTVQDIIPRLPNQQ